MLGILAELAPTTVRADAVRRELDIVLTDARRIIPSPTDLEEALRLGEEVVGRLDEIIAELRADSSPIPVRQGAGA